MTTNILPFPHRTPPRHALILCHPAEDSLNAAAARTYRDAVEGCGHEVVVRDLYRIGFDPVLRAKERPGASDRRRAADVQAELDALAGADVFVLVYPLWFGSAPAMLKGYVERVFSADCETSCVQGCRHPLLGGRHLLSITSSACSSAWLNERGVPISLRTLFDRYLVGLFGMASSDRLHMDGISPDMRRLLAEVELSRVHDFARRACALIGRAVSGPAEAAAASRTASRA